MTSVTSAGTAVRAVFDRVYQRSDYELNEEARKEGYPGPD